MNKKKYSILALEPYYGGSHRAFLDGWIENSRHDWTLLTLPAYKWRWRMRHAALTFATELRQLTSKGKSWDIIFCSDMLNLPSFLGLAPEQVRRLPTIVYFHENQLTYPVQNEDQRDYQSIFINFITASAATQVWFNSDFNRDSFLENLPGFLKKMPDYRHLEMIDIIKDKSTVHYPGIIPGKARKKRKPGQCRILWAARWEHDKNPEDFFSAMKIVKDNGLQFRLSVVGESFRTVPPVFDSARESFKEHIDHWGYLESQEDYLEVLADADLVVSTAIHEFFGISVMEAVASGTYPVLPERLAYPEIFADENGKPYKQFFYSGSPEHLAEKISGLIRDFSDNGNVNLKNNKLLLKDIITKYYWSSLSAEMDQAVATCMS